MNKTKLILATTGGVIGLAVLVMGFFTWSAFSARTVAREGDDEAGTPGLETVLEKARSLSKKEIYPCAASLKALESNKTVLVEWRDEARTLATRGDRLFDKTTPAAFKEFLVRDARRLTTADATRTNLFVHVAPDFAFGPFKDFISGGKMPTDAELPVLQRKWDDVSILVEILARSGIASLTDVAFAAAAVAEEDKGQKTKDKKKKPVRKSNQTIKQSNNQTIQPIAHSYTFSFSAKPAAFVRVLNALAVSERFVTVEGFSFTRPRDAVAEALGGEEKPSGAAAAPSGRRRRRGVAPAAEEKRDAGADARSGVVTDPVSDEPLSVVLTVNVRDYRSLEEVKSEEVKK